MNLFLSLSLILRRAHRSIASFNGLCIRIQMTLLLFRLFLPSPSPPPVSFCSRLRMSRTQTSFPFIALLTSLDIRRRRNDDDENGAPRGDIISPVQKCRINTFKNDSSAAFRAGPKFLGRACERDRCEDPRTRRPAREKLNRPGRRRFAVPRGTGRSLNSG